MKLTEAQATIIVGILGVVIAAITYSCTEQSKLEADSYIRRAERYERLVASATSFYITADDLKQRAVFLRELDQCWLYCPDHVIRACYRFLDTVKTGSKVTDADREKAFKEFIVTIRQDIVTGSRVTKSNMKATEYQILKANTSTP